MMWVGLSRSMTTLAGGGLGVLVPECSPRLTQCDVLHQLCHIASDDKVCRGEEWRGQAHQPVHPAHRRHGQHGRGSAVPVCGGSVHCTTKRGVPGLREDHHHPVSAGCRGWRSHPHDPTISPLCLSPPGSQPLHPVSVRQGSLQGASSPSPSSWKQSASPSRTSP